MKTLLLLTILFIPLQMFAQDNLEISTTRIGPYKLQMKGKEAQKLSGKKLIEYNDYRKYNSVLYNGNEIRINVFDDGENDVYIFDLATVDPAYKTKSGIGVGSTKKQLFDAYINFPNFSVYQSYDENGNLILGESYFNLEDRDAATILSFKMQNNIVVEVRVTYNVGY